MKKSRFGRAFPDQLAKVTQNHGHFNQPKNPRGWSSSFIFGDEDVSVTKLMSSWRKLFFVLIYILATFFLLVRLFNLQVIYGQDNLKLADSNRIQIKVIHAPRGVIHDRNGKIIARNEPGFRLVEKKASGSASFKYVTRDEALKLEIENKLGKRTDGSESFLEIDNLRTYPHREKAAHILGYISEITEDELKMPKFSNYKQGDRIGRGGTEEIYEKVLRGVDGGEVIEVDAQGNKIRTLRKNEAIPGQNLYLAIDIDLHLRAYDELKKAIAKAKSCCGSAVVQDPRSGEILSLVSIPSFDPSDISQSLSEPNSPFLNRPIAGTYPPGSTYKIASSLAGLSTGKITEKTAFEDTGVIYLGTFKYSNWYFTQYGRKEEGLVDVVKALKRSNDIFFYRLGQEVGEKAIADYSRQLGLGKVTGIDLPGEQAGLIPSDEWKKDNYGEGWYPGDTLHMSIGQGFILTTPLQVAQLVNVVASDGKQYPPHLALKITNPQGGIIKEYKYTPIKSIEIDKDDLSLVKKGLEEVTKDGGTAWPFFTFPIPTAGKTGTAEFGVAEKQGGNLIYKTHAWYTSYAPIQDPKISVTVMIEGGGEGSSDASPVAKEIFRFYFSEDKNNLIKDTTPISTSSARPLSE